MTKKGCAQAPKLFVPLQDAARPGSVWFVAMVVGGRHGDVDRVGAVGRRWLINGAP